MKKTIRSNVLMKTNIKTSVVNGPIIFIDFDHHDNYTTIVYIVRRHACGC